MECVTCHATIADKAIVCYRCGTPTASPAELRRSTGVTTRPWAVVGLCALAAAALGLAATRVIAGSLFQISLAIAAVFAAAVGVVAAWRR